MSGTATVTTGTILDRIIKQTTVDVRRRQAETPLADLERMAADRPDPVSLRATLSGPDVSVIAEIKRASPSRGVFPVVVDPPAVAREYLAGGAAALSVLTDEPYFRGSLRDLQASAAVAHAGTTPAPVLRKDFVVDRFQILEACAYGADAVLLIVAALTDAQLRDLVDYGIECGLEALIEVHDAEELRRASSLGASLIGINNRDLRTFEIDLAVTERLAPDVPRGAVLVGESGIFTRADVDRLHRVGVHAVLVGESLIVSPDRSAAVAALLRDG
jgi:indole-3-glycerol phosphate synthase